MKKRLPAFILGMLAVSYSVAWAQPTLTATGCNPVIGETATYYNGTHLSQGGSGANQNWDYTALAGGQGDPTSWVAPSSTTQGSSFPTANIAGYSSTTTNTSYFANSGTVRQSVGVYANTVVTTYSDPEDFLRYPFTMGDSYVDTWGGQYTNSGFTFYRSGTISVTADAYGTMVTPGGTFTDVVRVHFVEAYQDSANLGSPIVTTYTNDEYAWYKDGVHDPIAWTFTFTSLGGTTTSSGYVSFGAVGTDPATAISLDIFPTPASDQLTLELGLAQAEDVKIVVMNAIGQEVEAMEMGMSNPGLNRFQVGVSTLPAGIYFAKIMLNGQSTTTKRFVVAR